MTHERLHYLIHQYAQQRLSDKEEKELNTFLDNLGESALPHDAVDAWLRQSSTAMQPEEFESTIQRHLNHIFSIDKELNYIHPATAAPAQSSHSRVGYLYKWGWIAASIIFLLSVGTYLLFTNKKSAAPAIVVTQTDIAPGKNGAILTLADGSQIVLDSLGNGLIATQNGTQVRIKDGGLAYAPGGASTNGISYNTVSTTKGRQFQLTLPDGTKAWLNAASSITYPTAFTGKERAIKVQGEAYLEVAGDERMPFRVNIADKAGITVLGTHFNVNAYANEPGIFATLLEGSIRISSGSYNTLLKPGQQAQIADSSILQPAETAIKVINDADVDQVMAWKNGLFNFEGVQLQEVMQQLERWYDITVEYENGVPDIRFGGELSRNVPLSEVLKGLEDMDIKFRMMPDRRLIISK